MDLEIMEDFITGVPAEEIAQRFDTTVDSILTRLEEMVEKIQAEVNQVCDKMEEEQ
jgi:DNA-directed RNA polymerase specialized sigma24 family protein